MKQKSKLLIIMFLCSLYIASLNGQEAIPATGGNATGAGGTSSYTIGQIVYNTVSGTTGTVNQGIQQPYEISIPTAIKEASGITLECKVYPNPTTDFLTLKIKDYDTQNLSYQLFNIKGNLIENKKVLSNETQIAMGYLPPGTYFLKVTDNNKDVKTFKIIKN